MFLAIVPAYNESARIGSVVRSLFDHVDHVVVVDDCSADNTASVAEAAGATVLRHKINRGQGAALETGHSYARKSGALHVIHFDGDGQFSPLDIPLAKAHLEQSGADILFGSRFLDDRTNMPWFKRHILNPIGRFIDRLMGNPKLSDAHNGFRILTAKALEHVVITQDRMAHASEIPQLAKRGKLHIVEFPVKVTYHEYGQGAMGGITIVKDLLLGKFVK